MKNKIAVFIIMLSLLLVSCKQEELMGQSPFVGGTEGVQLEFFEGSPPAEVFDGGDFPFDVVIKVKNEGEWHIPKDGIRLQIDGIRPEEFSKTANEFIGYPDEDLEPKRKDTEGNLIEGNPVFVEFIGFNHVSPIVGATQPFPFRVQACYEYGTLSNSLLCVRKNLMTSKDGICTINEDKSVYSSGAPVQITELRESRRASNKIGFTFKVKHVGSGDLFKTGSICDFSDRTSMDRLYLKVDTGMPGLTCSGLSSYEGNAGGEISLYGGEKIVTCTQELDSPTDYEFPVVIETGYNYLNGLSTGVTVKSSSI